MDPITWLNDQTWFGTGSNLLQYIGSVGLLSYLWHRWEHQCRAKRFCFRTGQIDVRGTSWKVCPKHSTYDHHKRMQVEHAAKHPDRHGFHL